VQLTDYLSISSKIEGFPVASVLHLEMVQSRGMMSYVIAINPYIDLIEEMTISGLRNTGYSTTSQKLVPHSIQVENGFSSS
jgi:hypothetical protein